MMQIDMMQIDMMQTVHAESLGRSLIAERSKKLFAVL